MSDPNGLVYYRGVYHLFFQHNPEADVPGNMSWGHASSPDLVHWTELPVAIPQGEGEEIFSGSVVVDHGNSSGFGVGDDPPLVATYTSAYSDGRQAQSLAFSTDAGMTWTKYFGNPVLDRASTSFRDPKVSWYRMADGSGYWLMVAVEAEARQIVFYRSDDLKHWKYLSTFGPVGSTEGLWECPDVFALPVDGDPDRITWVLIVSLNQGRADGGTSTRYFVGDFDGVRFTPATSGDFQRLDWGRDLYAAVGFDNTPRGRRILIGWMGNWSYAAHVPTFPWRGSMSLPRELSLVTIEGVVRLVQQPPIELGALEQPANRVALNSFDLRGIRPINGTRQYRLTVMFEPVDAYEVGLDLFVGDGQVTRLRYDVEAKRLNLDRTSSGETDFESSFASTSSAPVALRDGALQLEVFVDRASVEVFAQGGLVCVTEQVFAAHESTGLAIYSLGGLARVSAFELTPLRNASGRPTHLPLGTGTEASSVEEK
jgi:sucrose-6-phosphate hydrolase SacC (GH32 family)